MKAKWHYQAIFLLLLLFRFDAFAQEEPQVEIEFKLTDNVSKTNHSYKLSAISYSVSNPDYQQDEITLINDGSCNITLELAQEIDEFLLKWGAGIIKNVSGVITVVAVNGIKKPRNIAFTGGRISGSSESFYDSAGANTLPQISMNVKTLSVDGTTIFTAPKPDNQ
jgi:hypothetical protein